MRILILLLAFQLANAVTFDLNQCLDYAEKNNKSIQISDYQKQISDMNVKDARNRFFDISANGSYGLSGDDEDNLGSNLSSSVGVSGTLSPGLIHNYKYSKVSSVNTSLDYTDNVNNMKNYVTAAFFGVLIAKENLKLQKDKLEYSQKKFEEAQLRFSMGNMSQSDLLSFEVTLSEDTIDLKNKESDLVKQKQNLLYLMHYQIQNDEFDIEYKEELDTVFDFDKKELIEEALKNRPDIIKYQNYLGQQDLMLKMQYDNYLPSLSGVLAYDYGITDVLSYDKTSPVGKPFEGVSDLITGSLSLSINLSYSDLNGIDKNKVEVKKSKLSLESKILEVKNEITTKLLDLQNQKNNLELADKHIELAQKNLELAEKLFAIGDKSVSDYLKARNDFISAKNRKINYLYNFIISKYDLYNSVGRQQ
ncbi:MAG: TolC family protein [Candidatus Delongbacteria bacterium]|nr:TolC family protein [Candidatus Delongbacteria bacterium]